MMRFGLTAKHAGWLLMTFCVLLSSFVVYGDSTGWCNPSLDQGTIGKADNAYADDTSVADCDGGDVHDFWGYSLYLPAQAVIQGIAVRFDAELAGGAPAGLAVELSWDGGISWTTTGYEAWLAGVMQTYVVGGLGNLWGHTWSAFELDSTSFRVRINVLTEATGKVVKLDWLPVAVYYEPLTQELDLIPTALAFDPFVPSDFDTGFKEIGQALHVTSNVDWVVTIRGAAATWAYQGAESDPFKPVGDLEWAAACSAPEVTSISTVSQGMTTLDSQVAAGTPGTDIALQMTLRLLLSYDDDVPGSYSIPFVYTITTP